MADDNPEFFKQLGSRIAAYRHAVELSQEKLGERADVTASYVAHIEIGDRRPTVAVLLRIADAVNVPLWRLITDDRISLDEKAWDAASRDLGTKVQGLPQADLRALSYLASRLQPTALPMRLSATTAAAARAAESRAAPLAHGPRKPKRRR